MNHLHRRVISSLKTHLHGDSICNPPPFPTIWEHEPRLHIQANPSILKIATAIRFGHIDIGDGCWSQNVLVTTLRCWWRFWSPTSIIFLLSWRALAFKRCHQHRNSVNNIRKLSPTLSHQHHGVTNITVTPNKILDSGLRAYQQAYLHMYDTWCTNLLPFPQDSKLKIWR